MNLGDSNKQADYLDRYRGFHRSIAQDHNYQTFDCKGHYFGIYTENLTKPVSA